MSWLEDIVMIRRTALRKHSPDFMVLRLRRQKTEMTVLLVDLGKFLLCLKEV